MIIQCCNEKELNLTFIAQVHDVVDEDSKDYNAHAAAVWSAAEVHDIKTEQLFRYLQVNNVFM